MFSGAKHNCLLPIPPLRAFPWQRVRGDQGDYAAILSEQVFNPRRRERG